MNISGIVLCGGGSTRMGQDKAGLAVGDETMLTRVIRLVGTVADDLVVVAGDRHSRSSVASASVRVVRDPVGGLGPLAAIVTGLKAIRHDRAFITACDMPLLRPSVITRLLELAGEHDVCVPVWEGHLMSMCAVYRVTVIDEAERLIEAGERSVRGLIARVDAKKVDAGELRDIDPDLDSFFSCDTPEQYQKIVEGGGRD